jgi:hypothetical protein
MTSKKLRRIYEQDDDENKSPKEIADEGIEVLFEDDEVLLLQIFKRVSMEYYAPQEISRQYQHNDKKNYLVLSKGDKLGFWLQEPRYGAFYIEGFDGKTYLFNKVINEYPQIAKEIIELTGSDDTTYGMLMMIKFGKKYDRYDLRNLTDNFLWDIEYNEKKPSKSMVVLNFTHDEYFNTFRFENDEDRGYLDMALGESSYYSSGFFIEDSYEWTEGYIMRGFDDTNMELVKKILKYTHPALLRKNQFPHSDKFFEEASEFLYKTFYYPIDNIITTYFELKNEGVQESLRKEIVEDFADIFQRYGIYREDETPFNNYLTTVNILLSLYDRVEDKTIPLVSTSKEDKTVFRKLGKTFGEFGDYTETIYNYHNMDYNKFEEYAKDKLEEILEEIEENPEKYINKIGKIYDELSKLGYDLNKNYPLPTDNSKSFKIIDIDKDTLRITLYHFDKDTEKRSYSIDEFKNYISSGELFERLVRKLKKLL